LKQDDPDEENIEEEEYIDWERVKESIEENCINPDATVEYLFVEKAEVQLKLINDDQGHIMDFISLFFTGDFKNDDVESFTSLLLDELNLSVQDSELFRTDSVNLKDYKFALVDNDKKITEFEVLDLHFYEALKASLRNLLIVGKNFDIEAFKHHDIFNEWFDEYTNRF
jgi:hypothetical protein